MASLEDLHRAHSIDTSYYGSSFNPAPKPDVFGRKPATPLEVQKTLESRTVFLSNRELRRQRKK